MVFPTSWLLPGILLSQPVTRLSLHYGISWVYVQLHGRVKLREQRHFHPSPVEAWDREVGSSGTPACHLDFHVPSLPSLVHAFHLQGHFMVQNGCWSISRHRPSVGGSGQCQRMFLPAEAAVSK